MRRNRFQKKRAALETTIVSGSCCTLHESLVFPLRSSTESYADAAISTLRAHAAGKPI